MLAPAVGCAGTSRAACWNSARASSTRPRLYRPRARAVDDDEYSLNKERDEIDARRRLTYVSSLAPTPSFLSLYKRREVAVS